MYNVTNINSKLTVIRRLLQSLEQPFKKLKRAIAKKTIDDYTGIYIHMFLIKAKEGRKIREKTNKTKRKSKMVVTV